MMPVYHYTSVHGLQAIENSGYIMESTLSNADAFHGQGVYLTRLTPAEGRQRIAENNWGGLGEMMERIGKVERTIKLWIPANMLMEAQSDRDILVHKGRIYLSKYKYTTERLDQGGSWCPWWCVIQ